MGILDDAIREHLELKRKHGAGEDELKELEDSAFGPPERPGSENGDEAAFEAEEEDLLAEAEEPEPEGDATTVMPSEGEPFDQVAEEPAEPAFAEAEELSPAEQARQEYPQLQDTAAHAPIEAEEPSPVQSTEEQDALEISLFESDDDEEDFDVGEIDLELEDGEPVAEESAREHDLIEPDAVVDPDPTDESVVAGDESDWPAQAPEGEEEATGEAHDMLEETPDFLKEAPESDEMWFEQDEPKDFDFD